MAEEPGKVYYFNATPRKLVLLLGNHVLNSGLGGVQPTAGYKPESGSAARVAADKSGTATFGTENNFVVSFPAGESQEYPVVIDPNEYEIKEDLSLYIFFNQVVLVSATGKARNTVISGDTLTEAETEKLLTAAGVDS